MNILVKKIPLDELESFVNSTAFQELEIVPISPIRAKSYLANPHARPEDVVLFLAYSNNQLVAFRSIFADVVHSEGKNIHFGWCSGNWVHPKFRRKGISELLLNEAYEEWNQKLMFTNYAPNSEKLYLKTGKFKAIYLFNGARAYVFPKTRKLISNANKNSFYKLFYNLIDCCIRFYSFLLIPYYSKGHKSEIQFVETNTPDEECFSSIPSEHELFMHHKEKLEWAFHFPWISSTERKGAAKYPFSLYSNAFFYKTIKLYASGSFLGFFIFSVREGHLKTLFWNLPDAYEKEIAMFIKNYCVKNKIEMATVYKKTIATELFKRKFPFLHVKKYGQKIYSTFEPEVMDGKDIQDGTGDVIFT